MKNNTEKVCFLALLLFSICVNISNAQDITLDVVNLTFRNSHSLRWAGTEPARDVKVPQWSELYSEQEPCAFTMSNRIFINFEYRLSEPWDGGYLMVRATGTNGVNIFPFYCEPFIGDSTGEYINASSLQDAGVLTNNTIGCVNYELNWEYSLDMGNTWYSAGSTSNPCYITFAAPTAPWSSSIKCYVEMLWIACEEKLEGCNSVDSAMESLAKDI